GFQRGGFAMKLNRKQYDFSNGAITHQYPRHVVLEHLMINFYILLKHDGRRPIIRGGKAPKFTVEMLANLLIQQEQHGVVRGFRENAHVVEEWIYSDLVTITNRGREDKEKYAAPT